MASKKLSDITLSDLPIKRIKVEGKYKKEIESNVEHWEREVREAQKQLDYWNKILKQGYFDTYYWILIIAICKKTGARDNSPALFAMRKALYQL